jgi:FlaA1/EpsC-like NDP-sugar epimerase
MEDMFTQFQPQYVYHAAAYKHVPMMELCPSEAVKNNVLGTKLMADLSVKHYVERFVMVSTDKAVNPTNVMGASKRLAEIYVQGLSKETANSTKFITTRFGNVLGSNGSVIPFFIKKKKEGRLPITDPNMTRFNISLQEGVDMVLHAMEHAWGGEIFVPKIPSYRITEVAKAIAPEAATEIVGIRPGEKLHEEMITSSDSFSTYDLGRYYAILPQVPVFDLQGFINHFKATKVPEGFCYNSGENQEWVGAEELRSLIKTHVDPSFSV